MADLLLLDGRAAGRRILVAALGVLYLASLIGDRELRSLPVAIAVVALNLVLGAALVAQWRRPGERLSLVALGAVGVAMAGLAPRGAGIAPAYLAVAVVAARLPVRAGAPLAAAVALAASAAGLVLAPPRDPTTPALQLVGLGLIYLAVSSARRTREQQQLAREAQLAAAAAAERGRVAREVHDVLAHSLTALTVQLELARRQLAKDPADPAALATVERAHALARQGLDDARGAVATLRGEAVPGPERLVPLAREFEADTGVPCRVAIGEVPAGLSSEARVAIYRTAQEALTNARRHARATHVDISLRAVTGGVELTVENDGPAAPSLHAAGFGLAGLRERAELLGGRLEAGATGSGFRVRLWVPG